ncbi:MAG: hypothetical protein JEZ02_14810 [Desulfatibacillum sp.]|nr:hypothetical protein [Desulfatibacillum sp.]
MPKNAHDNQNPGGLFPCLRLSLSRKHFSAFFPLLQSGCLVQCPKPLSVEAFLLSLPGFPGATILDGIQTVFLDGRPVDDIKAATLEPDCELALSAAMPGALGAVMRRGGYYAAMRGHITFQEQEHETIQGAFCVTVKLFNLLLSQVGPSLLEHGIVLGSEELAGLANSFESGISRLEWKGQDIAPGEFSSLLESLPNRVRAQLVFKV